MEARADLRDLPADVIEALRSDVSSALQKLPAGDWSWITCVEHARVERQNASGRPVFRVLVPLEEVPTEHAAVWADLQMVPVDPVRRFTAQAIEVGPQPRSLSESIPTLDLRIYAAGREFVDDERTVPVDWRPTLTRLVDRLVAKDYAGLIADGFWLHGTLEEPDHLGIEIEEHPDELVALPPGFWDDLGHASVVFDEHWDDAPALPRGAQVHLQLWGQHGETDLSVDLLVTDHGDHIDVVIESIHC